ncbi:MAG: hypothetical protein GY847_35895, partial [Proteobacteria bacterium]|nr:hypothetical protein [Pseudomonadota bacterium]
MKHLKQAFCSEKNRYPSHVVHRWFREFNDQLLINPEKLTVKARIEPENVFLDNTQQIFQFPTANAAFPKRVNPPERIQEEQDELDRMLECEASMEEADGFLMTLGMLPTVLSVNATGQDVNDSAATTQLTRTDSDSGPGVRTRSKTRACLLQTVTTSQESGTAQEPTDREERLGPCTRSKTRASLLRAAPTSQESGAAQEPTDCEERQGAQTKQGLATNEDTGRNELLEMDTNTDATSEHDAAL